MADQKLKLTQLPSVQDAGDGLLLTNKGGIDYQTPVNQFLLAKNNLSDVNPSISRANLNVYSKDETLSLTGGSMPAFSSASEGLSGTTDGQYFMVPSGDGGVKYYRNNSGAAVLVGTVIGPSSVIGTIREYPNSESAKNDINLGLIPDGMMLWVNNADDNLIADEYINSGGVLVTTGRKMPSKEYIDANFEVIDQRINPLQESPDSLFDIVSSNGIRPFRIRSTDGVTEFESVAQLVTGDSGLNFNGSVIDNNAPDGWLFLIYSRNGLVIAGVKEDGTKVGWGGSDSGGGQAGGITPGDTAVGYDDIRNYTGDATVRDVVGERINGRFVVDASDTTSPDDGGGVLVGTDGRRWIRQCDFVSYDMFGAPRIPESVYQNYATLSAQGNESAAQALLADIEPADQAIARCHAFAAKHAIPVVQNVGRFLWVSGEIVVR
ncbi:TPA: hypothetical protein L7I91_005104, partial [Klebsiella aerogenes]|nr:hypothetical protein [Klebsiella aerogenes]